MDSQAASLRAHKTSSPPNPGLCSHRCCSPVPAQQSPSDELTVTTGLDLVLLAHQPLLDAFLGREGDLGSDWGRKGCVGRCKGNQIPTSC